MANLIITVISIALVAVAALMGAYYGGSAFMDGQAKANANTLVTQADQISAAWTLSATNNGGSYDTAGASGVGTGLVTSSPVYLTAAPVPPAAASSDTYTMVKLTTNAAATPYNGLRLALVTGDAARNVCKAVAIMAAGSTTAVPTLLAGLTTATTSVDVSPGTGRKFDCVEKTAASSDPRVFVYRATN